MYILGISCYYHDAAATLIKEGRIVAACEEERFTRKKHDNSFPINAINYCLSSQGINIEDIEYIGFYEKPLLKFERVLYQILETFPLSLKAFVDSMPSWITEKLRVVKKIKKTLKYKGDILFVEHHLAHAASAFLVSPFENSAILTIDGVGEWTTTAYGVGKGTDIELYKEIKFPHSLGLLYSTITAYLGFSVNNSEYKVMGLSAYGQMDKEKNKYYNKLKQVIDVKDDGSYRLDMKYFRFHYSNKMPSQNLEKILNGKIRKKDEKVTQRHKDIAAAVQLIYEEILFKILNHVYQETESDNIVLAGGAFLNSVANGKILNNTPFKNIWIQPNAGDGGTSMGAASYIYNSILEQPRNFELKNSYYGPEYSSKKIKKYLDDSNIKYSEFKNHIELIEKTAELIYKNNIVGWFQGKMEWGPRALGARSILSNATNPDMQNILNLRVKHREKFRPFAPVVCAEDAEKYFELDKPLPIPTEFMLMVYPIKKEFREKIPAVTHIDGSGRLQTIQREQNPLYYDLIKEFGKLSGVPILVNTSFNVRSEPIVCTPQDALNCMEGTEIDYLIIDKFMIKRNAE